MVFEILGPDNIWHDVLPLVEEGGLKFKLNDLDGPNAGRTTDGNMWRDKVAEKISFDVKMLDMHTLTMRALLSWVKQTYYQCRVTHPRHGLVEITAYTNTVPADVVYVLDDGYEIWGNVEFAVVER